MVSKTVSPTFRSEKLLIAERKNKMEAIKYEIAKKLMEKEEYQATYLINKEKRQLTSQAALMFKTTGYSSEGVPTEKGEDYTAKIGCRFAVKRLTEWKRLEETLQKFMQKSELGMADGSKSVNALFPRSTDAFIVDTIENATSHIDNHGVSQNAQDGPTGEKQLETPRGNCVTEVIDVFSSLRDASVKLRRRNSNENLTFSTNVWERAVLDQYKNRVNVASTQSIIVPLDQSCVDKKSRIMSASAILRARHANDEPGPSPQEFPTTSLLPEKHTFKQQTIRATSKQQTIRATSANNPPHKRKRLLARVDKTRPVSAHERKFHGFGKSMVARHSFSGTSLSSKRNANSNEKVPKLIAPVVSGDDTKSGTVEKQKGKEELTNNCLLKPQKQTFKTTGFASSEPTLSNILRSSHDPCSSVPSFPTPIIKTEAEDCVVMEQDDVPEQDNQIQERPKSSHWKRELLVDAPLGLKSTTNNPRGTVAMSKISRRKTMQTMMKNNTESNEKLAKEERMRRINKKLTAILMFARLATNNLEDT